MNYVQNRLNNKQIISISYHIFIAIQENLESAAVVKITLDLYFMINNTYTKIERISFETKSNYNPENQF